MNAQFPAFPGLHVAISASVKRRDQASADHAREAIAKADAKRSRKNAKRLKDHDRKGESVS